VRPFSAAGLLLVALLLLLLLLLLLGCLLVLLVLVVVEQHPRRGHTRSTPLLGLLCCWSVTLPRQWRQVLSSAEGPRGCYTARGVPTRTGAGAAAGG